ncbi:hypothetical protein LWM68_21870 [Niabella sp. W65]|nr:hypothetical protein [Niabella sp. W65]MCH7365178.1 hypothetical protein [Niabella sp. W65]
MNYNDPQKQTQLNKNAGKDLPGAAAWGGGFASFDIKRFFRYYPGI